MKSRLWFAAVAVLALAGTAAVFLPRPTDKVIDVAVVQTGGGNAMITVENVSIVEMTQSAIKWQLVTAGYTFPENGIQFDPKAVSMPAECTKLGNPDTAFHNCGPKQHGREFHCNRKPNGYEDDACYKYTVRVTPSGSNPQPPDKDPWIKNPPRAK